MSRDLLAVCVRLLAVVAAGAFVGSASADDKSDMEFFQSRVAPLLKEHCYRCHSHAAGKMRGGLALDSRSGWMEGGDSGPAIVPKQPDKSLLIQAIQHRHADTKMPPSGKLRDAEIAVLVDWVQRGAVDPRTSPKAVGAPADWWSLKPLVRRDPPAPGHPIDAFVRKALREKGLAPAPEADRRSLIRRLTFDLHGLPPTPEEVDAFLADTSPKAYETLVDRLLASPRHGERWARHWLDVVRYADSDGNEHDKFRPEMWRYRDYVIEAFNADKPYDVFVREQLAADFFSPDEPRLMAALGFLAAGPNVLSGTDYQNRDEWVTLVMSAFASTTAHCARCHSHKFDPITQDDYYALQAVFAGVQRRSAKIDLDLKIDESRRKWTTLSAAAKRRDAMVLASADSRGLVEVWRKTQAEKAPKWTTLRPTKATAESRAEIQTRGDGAMFVSQATADSDQYTLEFAGPLEDVRVVKLEALSDKRLPDGGPGLGADGAFVLSEIEVSLVDKEKAPARKIRPRSALADVEPKDQQVARSFDGNDPTGWGSGEPGRGQVAVFDLGQAVKIPEGGTLTIVLKHRQGMKRSLGCFRLSATIQELTPYHMISVAAQEAIAKKPADRSDAEWLALTSHAVPIVCEEKLKALPEQTEFYVVAGNLPRQEPARPKGISVLLRGDERKPMREAVPGALSCVPDLADRLDAKTTDPERRAYLARWLSDVKNPLTWRSIVNRVWHYHFGRGIVDTVNDFGHMGSTPTHPDLLDWLACEFRDGGMSLKRLHRLIVTSATYRQSTTPNPRALAIDADNRLLWRMNRNRVDAESYRDALLAISGRLNLKAGGPGVMQFEVKNGFNTTQLANYDAVDWNNPALTRRSVYRFVFRTRPDPFMSALDFPDAAQFVPTRPLSVTSLQSLVLFNSDFVLHQSGRLAERVAEMESDTVGQVRRAFRLTLLREPTPQEIADVTTYVQRHGLPAACRVLFNSNEFLFLE